MSSVPGSLRHDGGARRDLRAGLHIAGWLSRGKHDRFRPGTADDRRAVARGGHRSRPGSGLSTVLGRFGKFPVLQTCSGSPHGRRGRKRGFFRRWKRTGGSAAKGIWSGASYSFSHRLLPCMGTGVFWHAAGTCCASCDPQAFAASQVPQNRNRFGAFCHWRPPVSIGMVGRALLPGLLTTASEARPCSSTWAVSFFPPLIAGLILAGILAPR